MTNTLASMIQREQDTDPENRNALASDINWVTPNVGQVAPKWVSTSDAPWIERAYRDVKDIGDVVARGALDLPNKLMMAVTDREAPAWALRNLTPAGQMVQGANQFAAGLRGTEVAENIWDQPEPLADAPWLQRVGNMATGIANMALAYAPMEKAVGGAVGSIGARVADKWPMQKGIYVGPKSKAWTARPQIGTEGETVPEGAFSSLYDRKPRVEIDDSGARFVRAKNGDRTIVDVISPEGEDPFSARPLWRILDHPELFEKYPHLEDLKVRFSPIRESKSAAFDPYKNEITLSPQLNPKADKKLFLHEITHAIQEKEGWARGGSPAQFDVDRVNYRNDFLRLSAKDAIDLAREKHGGWPSNEQAKAAWKEFMDEELPDWALQDARQMERQEIQNRVDEQYKLFGTLPEYSDSINVYKRLAGEIEARDAAARANMTMAERRATPPYSSENIPVNEAIVRFDRNGPQAMVRPGEGGQIEGYVEGPERDANFKKWFGDSKVVDDNGDPLTVYKGMPVNNYENNQPIEYIQRQTEFPAFYKNEPSIKIAGFFSNNPEVANRFASIITKNGEGNGVFPVNISFKKPFVIDAKGDHAGNIEFGESGKMFRDAVRSGKYDGVIIKNTADEGDVYVTLQPNQSKSIFNRGTFDPKDPRILYGAGAGLAAYGSTQDSKDVSDAPWLSNK